MKEQDRASILNSLLYTQDVVRACKRKLSDDRSHDSGGQLASSAGPCDAIDAAVTQQQQTVDAAADALLLEQLTLMILQMQQMMCHSQNA